MKKWTVKMIDGTTIDIEAEEARWDDDQLKFFKEMRIVAVFLKWQAFWEKQ
jgi:hypothetical protein